MLILSMNNRDIADLFNLTPQETFIEEQVIGQSRLENCHKRPSCYVSWSQPSASKRCRNQTFSSTEARTDLDEMNTQSSFEQELNSGSSDHSSNYSSFQQPYEQQKTQQSEPTDESTTNNQQRFLRTTEILKESGLYDVAVRTAALIRQNQQSRAELEKLREETKLFLRDVLSNPENKNISQLLNNLE